MAARQFKMLAFSPSTVEGVAVRRGEPLLDTAVSRRFPPDGGNFFEHLSGHVEVSLAGSSWTGSQVVLVIPSDVISLRKVEFPFRDARKIEQALIFELENELIEDVTSFVYSHVVVPEEDDFASVLVYLVPTEYLHGCLDILQEKQLAPSLITFSAQALHQLYEAESPLHYQVYIGADEVFASCVSAGRLQAVKSFSLDHTRIFPQPTEQASTPSVSDEISPAELLQLMQGEAQGHPDSTERPGQQWRGEFDELASDIMRFIGPHNMGQAFTVSLHGLFAPFFGWDEQSNRLKVLPAGAIPAPLGRPSFWGIMEELAGAPQKLLATRAVNFFRNRSGIGQQVQEFRRPLAVMGMVALLILALFGANYGMRISAHQAGLERIDGQLTALLKKSVRGNRSVVQSMRILEERLEKRKKESNASARFTPYTYATMTLLQDLSGLFKESPELSLKALSLKGGRFTISGTTKSYDSSESFKNRLAKLERFNKAEATITHQRIRSDITFRIVIKRNGK